MQVAIQAHSQTFIRGGSTAVIGKSFVLYTVAEPTHYNYIRWDMQHSPSLMWAIIQFLNWYKLKGLHKLLNQQSFLINLATSTQCLVDEASQLYCPWTCTMFHVTSSDASYA